ncbi:MAG TPA: DUF2510 domain-containing protein [Pseudolysinimonas sp.]|nr:DUF2510 domain-containing protein [Pseudolysinimonas sp.]
MADDVPAGWYPTPNGGHRYWDGTKWTSLPWDGDDGTSDAAAARRRPFPTRWVLLGLAALVVAGLVLGGLAWKSASDAEAAAVAAAQQQADEEQAAAEAQERKDDAERESRKETVKEIEASVKKMAERHAKDDIIDGPIIDVTCSPLGGGSTDDLSEQTTVFDCFVANKDNGDGTMSGYTYNATMNWSTGSYTYGLGPA